MRYEIIMRDISLIAFVITLIGTILIPNPLTFTLVGIVTGIGIMFASLLIQEQHEDMIQRNRNE